MYSLMLDLKSWLMDFNIYEIFLKFIKERESFQAPYYNNKKGKNVQS